LTGKLTFVGETGPKAADR